MKPISVDYSRIADTYHALRGGADRSRALAEICDTISPPHARILDVGAGTGAISRLLAAAGHEVLPIDIAEGMAAQAAAANPGRCAQADSARLPFISRAFDTVLFIWVFHLVGDPINSLSETRRVLKPAGSALFIAGLPGPMTDDMDPIHSRMTAALTPERFRRDDQLPAMATDCGFNIDELDPLVQESEMTPNELATRIEQDKFSSTWNIEPQTRARIVTPAVNQLRALPDPDSTRHRVACHRVFRLRST